MPSSARDSGCPNVCRGGLRARDAGGRAVLGPGSRERPARRHHHIELLKACPSAQCRVRSDAWPGALLTVRVPAVLRHDSVGGLPPSVSTGAFDRRRRRGNAPARFAQYDHQAACVLSGWILRQRHAASSRWRRLILFCGCTAGADVVGGLGAVLQWRGGAVLPAGGESPCSCLAPCSVSVIVAIE